MGYEYLTSRIVEMTGPAASAEMFYMLLCFLIGIGIIVVMWKALKPALMRQNFKHVYFIAKLKEYAGKQGYDLEEEMDNVMKRPFLFKTEKNIEEEESNHVKDIDEYFEELKTKERKKK